MSVIVVTTTFYRSPEEERFRLAKSLVRRAVAAADAIFVVDDSSDVKVAEELRSLGARVVKQEESGMAASRRQVFRLAVEWLAGVRCASAFLILSFWL